MSTRKKGNRGKGEGGRVLANSKQQAAGNEFRTLSHLAAALLFAVYCLLFTACKPSLSACLLLPCPFRIILSLLEARSYRPVGSRPLFLLGE
jgi:hypothetical protein